MKKQWYWYWVVEAKGDRLLVDSEGLLALNFEKHPRHFPVHSRLHPILFWKMFCGDSYGNGFVAVLFFFSLNRCHQNITFLMSFENCINTWFETFCEVCFFHKTSDDSFMFWNFFVRSVFFSQNIKWLILPRNFFVQKNSFLETMFGGLRESVCVAPFTFKNYTSKVLRTSQTYTKNLRRPVQK